MFGTLFWIFLIVGMAIAALGFTSIYKRVDDQNSNGNKRSE